MTQEMTVQSTKLAGLPKVSELSNALKAFDLEVGLGGTAILKCDKTGHWVYGANQTEIEEGSQWAINPFSFIHGFIAWGDAEVLGEKMAPIIEPLPELPASPEGAKKGWERQVGVSLKCLNGEDTGLEARFSTTSVGGMRAIQELASKIAAQVDKDQTKPVAVVDLSSEHYQHKKYGRIYVPVFTIVEWLSLDATTTTDEPEVPETPAQVAEVVEPTEAAPEPVVEEATTRRRRR